MGKMELEIKILNINKNEFIEKLKKLDAKLIYDDKQILYTYDLPTIYGRFNDILFLINNPESKIKYQTAIEKMKLLFFEVDNLLTDSDRKELIDICNIDNLIKLSNNKLLDVINQKDFALFIQKFKNNSKKWIRLRQSKDVVTINVKHILAPNNSGIQQMLENEIKVESIEDANSFLEALGYSYKSFQEKERITFKLGEYEIDIDTWPGIPTYFEIEGNSREELEQVLTKLGYSWDDCVSCTADDIYKMYGKSMFDKRELVF